MKRITQMATLSLVLLATASLYAQEPPSAPPPGDPAAPAPVAPPPAAGPGGGMLIGGDLQIGLPVGNFSDAAGIGIGGMGRFEYVLNPQLNLTGRLGFVYYLPKTVNGFDAKFWTIPILVGAKFNLNPNLYLAGEFGLFNNHFTTTVPFFGSVSSSETDAGLTVGAGYRLNDLDLRVMLEILNLGHAGDSMSVVASAGYNFWKK